MGNNFILTFTAPIERFFFIPQRRTFLFPTVPSAWPERLRLDASWLALLLRD